jgi:hypothetical protein
LTSGRIVSGDKKTKQAAHGKKEGDIVFGLEVCFEKGRGD